MAYQSLPSMFGIPNGNDLSLYGLGNQPSFGNVGSNELTSLAAGGTAGSAGNGWFGGATDWMNNNGQTINTLLNGFGALSSGFNSFRNYGLAKDNFGLQKRAFETNLRNSEKTYNNALEDRIRGRSSEMSESDIQAASARQRLGG